MSTGVSFTLHVEQDGQKKWRGNAPSLKSGEATAIVQSPPARFVEIVAVQF